MAEMRPFDKHLKNRLLRFAKFWARVFKREMTADDLTFIRIPLTAIFAIASEYFPWLYPLLCYADGFLDLGDGAYSRIRRDITTPNGWFWDQACDKFSNDVRVFILWHLLPASALVLDTTLWNMSAFWLLMSVMISTDIILLSFRIVHLFKPSTKPVLKPGEQTSVQWGKIKVWPQQFGIVLLAVAYTHMIGWPTWITVTTSLVGAALLAELIPKDVRFCRLYQAGIFLLFALSFPNPLTNMIPFNTGILLGQIGLAGSIPLGFMSLGGQISRQYAHSWAPRQTREKTPNTAPAEN